MKRGLEKGFVFLVLIMFLIVLVSAGFVFAQSSDLEKLDFPDGSDVRGVNVKLSGINMVYFNGNGYLEIRVNREVRKYENIKSTGRIIIEKGEIIEAFFEVLEKGKYKFGDKEFVLPKGTHVEMKNKEVKFKVPEDSEIEEPEKLSRGDSGLNYFYESSGSLRLPNGEIVRGGGENIGSGTKIGYDSGGFFVSGDLFVQKNGNDEFKLKNYGKTYLAMSEGDLTNKRNEVFIGKDKLILSNPTSLGSVVSFSKENRFGIAVDNEHSTYAQAVKGKIIVNANEGKLAEIQFSGNSIVDLDKKSFFAHDNRLYVDTKKGMIGGVEHAENDAAVQLSLVNQNNNKILDSNIISNGKNQYAQVADRDLKSALEYYKAGNFYVSTSVAFNQLTPEAQGFYDGLSKEKQKEIGDAILKLNSGQGEALVQRVINEYRIEQERIRQNPFKASVRIPSGGGSGTIIGVDKDGYPIILTVAHMGGTNRPGTQFRVELSTKLDDGKWRFKATAIGAGSFGRNNDVALMRLNTKIPDIPYVPVAPEGHNIKKGEVVQRIGCPGCGNFRKTNFKMSKIGNSYFGGNDVGRTAVIGGESGGGVFHNGRVIGIVSHGDDYGYGGYTSPTRIRAFLVKHKLEYLIKIWIVF